MFRFRAETAAPPPPPPPPGSFTALGRSPWSCASCFSSSQLAGLDALEAEASLAWRACAGASESPCTSSPINFSHLDCLDIEKKLKCNMPWRARPPSLYGVLSSVRLLRTRPPFLMRPAPPGLWSRVQWHLLQQVGLPIIVLLSFIITQVCHYFNLCLIICLLSRVPSVSFRFVWPSSPVNPTHALAHDSEGYWP